MKNLSFLSAIFFFCFSTGSVLASEIIFPENKNHERIVDEAEIFSSEEEIKILQQIKRIEDETTAQIAILTLPTLQNLEMFDYGMQLLEHKNWQVGHDDKDNGLVLIIAPNERKYRFFTGYGLEGILPDLRLKLIAENYFPENFRAEKYAEGILFSLIDIEKFLLHDEEIISQYKKQDTNIINIFAPIFLIVISFIFAFFIARKKEKIRNIGILSGTTLIGLSILTPFIPIVVGIWALAIFWIHSQPKKNTFKEAWENALLESSSGWSSGSGFSSGGGFSNFGGGDFGGGGFGGDW